MDHQLVLRAGRVLSGTGDPAQVLDVGIDDGAVSALAPAGRLRGTQTIDSDGLCVAPGFVDLHSHVDYSVIDRATADTALRQGVTTLVVGNCGFSPFPVVDPSGVEALRRQSAFLGADLTYDWSDADGFAAAVHAVRPAVNLALQVGHHALRTAVIGTEDRPAAPAEIERMVALLDVAADQGVVGFSTGMIYVPGRFAGTEELVALAAAAARHDLLYSTHVRDETAQVRRAVDEAIDTAERSGVRLEISHLKAMGRAAHGAGPDLLARLDAARSRGVRVGADAYPYTASSTTLATRLPGWSLDGGTEALLHRLGDPAARARIAAGLAARMPGEVDPAGVVIASVLPGGEASVIGRSVAELARDRGQGPAEVVLDLLAGSRGSVGIVNHSMDDADLLAILAHPQVAVASDGSILRADRDPTSSALPHPRSFGTFTRFLSRYVREQGVVDWPDAIRKITSLPAGRAGLGGRGTVRVGAVADLTVFDADRIDDRSTYADPWAGPSGVEHVLVAGRIAVRSAQLTDVRAGAVLRRSPGTP